MLAMILLLLMPIQSHSQTPGQQVYIGVTFYKVNPGKSEAYANLVRSHAHRVVEQSVRNGDLLGWYFYQVLMSPEMENKYDYVVVTVSPKFNDLVDNPVSMKERYSKAITGSKEMNWESYNSKLLEYRSVVKYEVYAHRAGIDPKTPVSKYVQIDYMKPLPGKTAEYIKTEREIFYPIHQERIKLGALTDWGLYEKVLPFTANSENDFVTANFFENLKSLIDPKYEEAFNYIPNNSNYIIMSERVDQVRKMVRSDIWKLIDHVDQGTIK